MAIGYSSFVTPAGNVPPAINGSYFNAQFNNTAVFTNSDGGSCAAGEYRQQVMGSFEANGSVLTHVLCGAIYLSPVIYQEDGCPSGSCTAYGHRTCPAAHDNQYTNPNQATGADYEMEDRPGFSNIAGGVRYRINLSFKGSLINTANATELVTRSWSVQGETVAPTTLKSTATTSLTAGADKVVAVHFARNLETGLGEVHVVITRPPQSPALSASAISLKLHDADGTEVSTVAAQVYEVSALGRTTASIVFTLPAGSSHPLTGHVTWSTGSQVFEIHDR